MHLPPHDPAKFNWRSFGTAVGEGRGKKTDRYGKKTNMRGKKTERQRVGAKRKVL